MSNHLAIATVTATLQRLLQNVVQRDVEGARVTTLKPHNIGNGTPDTGVNLFLYQVEHNTALRNGDMASFRSQKGPIRRQSSLDLFYMLSTYGNEAELEPQRLLGSVVRTLSDKTVLSSEMIDGAIADTTFLRDSDLITQKQPLTINPVKLDTDELSKIWSTFFQAPYALSLVYKVMAVVIDGEVSAQRALPVRERRVGQVKPFPHRPTLENVVAIAGLQARPQARPQSPIQAETLLQITGQQLKGPHTRVKLQAAELVPKTMDDAAITISLGDVPRTNLRAGIQTVQVLHYASAAAAVQSPSTSPSTSPSASPSAFPSASASASPNSVSSPTVISTTIPIASNALPFVLCPTVIAVEAVDIVGLDDDPRQGYLQVRTNVIVGSQQQVLITLNEWSVDHPVNYSFQASPRPVESDRLDFYFNHVKPGEYLVRVQIDGADSVLGVDPDPDSPTFNWFNRPRVVIA